MINYSKIAYLHWLGTLYALHDSNLLNNAVLLPILRCDDKLKKSATKKLTC